MRRPKKMDWEKSMIALGIRPNPQTKKIPPGKNRFAEPIVKPCVIRKEPPPYLPYHIEEKKP